MSRRRFPILNEPGASRRRRSRSGTWSGNARGAGSADSRIRNPVPNAITGFVQAHPTIRLIALNGSTAGHLYHHLAPVPGIPSVTLPSTSPANAAVTFAKKVRQWEMVRTAFVRD